ncbi:MAG: type II toxin-antitoxin system VapC family toxin [Acidobacteriaceae bacterium]
MMVLVDTSIWIDFFRTGSHKAHMERLVQHNQLVMHPFLIAELALGNLRNRRRTLTSLDRLPQVPVVTLGEVRSMVEARRLHNTGIGLVDAHLVASCLTTPGTWLWTGDTRLATVARSLGILPTFS